MTLLQSLFSLDSTLGVFFLAGIFSTCLWGMGCIQLYYYYETSSNFDDDNRWIKPYSTIIWFLDTVHQGFFIASLYRYLITNYGNVLYLVRIDKVIIYMGMGSAIIDAMVQFVFVFRAWKLSNRNHILTGALTIAVVGQLSATLAYAGEAVDFVYVPQLFSTISTERAMNAVWVVTDTFIALVLALLLRKLRLGYERTNSVLDRLILYSVGTGLVTGVVGVAALIGSELLPQSLIYLLSDLMLPKLYLNCLLVSLNARVGLRERLVGDVECTDLQFTEPSIAAGSSPSVVIDSSETGSSSNLRTINCEIDIEVRQEPVDQQVANDICVQTDNADTGTKCPPSEGRTP